MLRLLKPNQGGQVTDAYWPWVQRHLKRGQKADLASAYPMHERTLVVTQCGRICMDRRKINFSQVFAGQRVGVRQVDDKIWLVSFMDYDLGYFDEESNRVEPGANPFGAKVLPMSPV